MQRNPEAAETIHALWEQEIKGAPLPWRRSPLRVSFRIQASLLKRKRPSGRFSSYRGRFKELRPELWIYPPKITHPPSVSLKEIASEVALTRRPLC